ncbi:hypothetical protein V8C86DRAFT_2446287 [Haematococcus lacustris]
MILLRSRSSVPPSQQQHPEGPLLNQQPQGPHRRQQQVQCKQDGDQVTGGYATQATRARYNVLPYMRYDGVEAVSYGSLPRRLHNVINSLPFLITHQGLLWRHVDVGPGLHDNQRLKHCRRPAAPIEASMQQQLIARQPAAIQRQGSNTATRYGINPTTYRICWRNTNSLLAHLFAG